MKNYPCQSKHIKSERKMITEMCEYQCKKLGILKNQVNMIPPKEIKVVITYTKKWRSMNCQTKSSE